MKMNKVISLSHIDGFSESADFATDVRSRRAVIVMLVLSVISQYSNNTDMILKTYRELSDQDQKDMTGAIIQEARLKGLGNVADTISSFVRLRALEHDVREGPHEPNGKKRITLKARLLALSPAELKTEFFRSVGISSEYMVLEECLNHQLVPIDSQDQDGKTILHHIARHNHESFLSLVMYRFVVLSYRSLEYPDVFKKSPVFKEICSYVHQLREVESKTTFKRNLLDIQDAAGRTPLHEAVDYRHADLTLSLIALSSAINTQDAEGRTPLHIAGMNGDVDITAKLLKVGADAGITDNLGKTYNEYLESAIRERHEKTMNRVNAAKGLLDLFTTPLDELN